MNRRYQVFISSTYSDLKDEREKVMRTLLKLNYIPAGMELFPSTDVKQEEYIKRVIDESDYYLLIVGGRYGSIADSGISYTELEFDYAVSKGKTILAFLHENLQSIPLGKSELSEEMRNKLNKFRDKVSTGRLVSFWNNAEELGEKVAVSLSHTTSQNPALGWVRFNPYSDIESSKELDSLRKELESTKAELANLKIAQKNYLANLAGLDEKIIIHGTKHHLWQGNTIMDNWECEVSWKLLFMSLAPYLMDYPNDKKVEQLLTSIAFSYTKKQTDDIIEINSQDFQTIKLQFIALKLVKVSYLQTTKGDMALFWSLTDAGNQLMMQLRTVKSTHRNLFKRP